MVRNTRFIPLLFVFSFIVLSCTHTTTEPGDSHSEIALLDTTRQADMLVISPERFTDSLASYQSWRNGQGIQTAIISTEDIELAFPDDSSTREAIYRFLWYAYQQWQEPALRYVLLVGDTEIIPTYFLESPLADSFGEEEFATDWQYALHRDSLHTPIFAIGRWPCTTAEEVRRLVKKTQLFESNTGYQHSGVVIAQTQVAQLAEHIANDVSSENYAGYSSGHTDDNYLPADSLVNLMNEGIRTVTTILASAPTSAWGDPVYFGWDELYQLTNTRIPWLGLSTARQLIHEPGDHTFAEELLLAEEGAASILVPTGLVYTYPVANTFSRLLRDTSDVRFGARIQMELGKYFTANNLKYTLLGDPALQLAGIQ